VPLSSILKLTISCIFRIVIVSLSIGNRFFVHRRIVSAVKRVEFVSGRLSYIVLRGRWRNIVVVNVHAPSEEKNDGEFEQVFNHFSK